MSLYSFERRQIVRRPVREVFAFFEHPENLAALTPPELGLTILTPSPVVMKPGALIDYTIRLLGLPVRWTTLITSYDPPRMFVDEQLRGPYSFWHHTHRFVQTDDGTLIIDEVRFALPFGIPGRLAYRLFVRRQLEKIFDYRAGIIERIFPGDGPPGNERIPGSLVAHQRPEEN